MIIIILLGCREQTVASIERMQHLTTHGIPLPDSLMVEFSLRNHPMYRKQLENFQTALMYLDTKTKLHSVFNFLIQQITKLYLEHRN